MDIFKNLVFPILSPLMTIVGIMLIATNERKKILEQNKIKTNATVDLIYRDLHILLATCETLLQDRSNVRIIHFKNLFQRFLTNLYSDPRLFGLYFHKLEFQNAEKNNIYLLLSELELKINNMTTDNLDFRFMFFTIHSLIYIYERDSEKEKIHLEAIELIQNNDPTLYERLRIIKK